MVTFDYACDPGLVWDINTRFDSFGRLMTGVATFEGMPEARQLARGDVFDVRVRLFGWMPAMPYRMEVVDCDHAARRFCSVEFGGSIRQWAHVSEVVETPEGCRFTDSVTVDAGLATPLMPFWVRNVHRSRHAPRLEIIAKRRAGLPSG